MKYFFSIVLFVFFMAFCEGQTISPANPPAVCSPANVPLSVSGGTGITAYQWIKDGVYIPSATTTNYTATVTGIYKVKITTGPLPPDTTIIGPVTVTINSLPATPSFTFSTNNQCASLPLNFVVTSSVPGVTYTWDFGNGITNINGTSVNHLYDDNNSIGNGTFTYSVKVTAKNGAGCTVQSTSQFVTVAQKPNAILFEQNNFRFCGNIGNILVNVTDISIPKANNNFEIIWGDVSSNYSSAIPPANLPHTYQTGIFTLTYNVTGSNGCKATKTYNVLNITNPRIGAGIPSNTQGCGPLTVCFPINNFSDNHSSTLYTADFGDGSSSVPFSHPPPDSVCHTYKTTSCGAAGNKFNFKILAFNGCDTSDGLFSPIRLYTKPIAKFTIDPTPSCVNTPVSFSNTTILGYNNSCSVSATYKWDFGDGSPVLNVFDNLKQVHTYTVPGNFQVKLIAQNTCDTSSYILPLCIEGILVPSFTLSNYIGCTPLKSTVNNTTNTLNSCQNPTYKWLVTYTASFCGTSPLYTFVNNTSDTSANPSFSFTNPGTYTIKLDVTNACGTFTTSKIVTVKTKLVASINTPANTCVNQFFSPTPAFNCYIGPVTYAWSFAGGNPASSTDSLPGTITYNTPGNKTITLDVTNECGTTTVNKTITVNPTPVIQPNRDTAYCGGLPSGAFNFSSSVTGTSYTWTNNFTTIGLAASGTGNIASFTTSNNSNSPIVATIIVTPNLNGCVGIKDTFLITINPTPAVSQPLDQVHCNGASTTAILFTGSNVSGTIYNWTNSNPVIGLAASGIGNIASFITTNTTNAPVTATITVTPAYSNSGSSCSGISKSFTITVNPIPTVTQPSNQELCNGALTTTISFSGSAVSGTTYSWSNDNTAIGLASTGIGTIAAFTATNSTNAAIVANITVTPNYSNAGKICSGSPQTFTITVNPAPLVQFSPATNQTICSGNATNVVTLTSSTSGATISWVCTQPAGITGVVTSGTTTIPVQTLTNLTNAPITVNYIAKATTSGNSTCPGASSTYSITVNPGPDVNQPASLFFCTGTQTAVINFTSTVAGTTYSWANNNIAIGLASTGTGNITSFNAINTSSLPITATITVTPNILNGGVTCTGPSKTFTITVNPSPSVTQPANEVLCNGASSTVITFGGSSVSGTTYSWINDNPSINLPAGNKGDVASFVATNTGNVSIVAKITVTPSSLSGGKSCDGSSKSFTITVNPTPTITQPPNQVFCNGTTTSSIAFASNVSGTTYTWTNDNNLIGLAASGFDNIPAFNATNTGTSVVTATITVTPNFLNGGVTCIGPSKTFTITINPTPTVTLPVNQVLCNGSSTALISFGGSAVSGTTYSWVNNTTSIGLAASNTGDINSFTAVNTSSSPVVATITVTPSFTNGGQNCSGPAKTFTITVNPAPLVNFSSGNQTICSGGSTIAISLSSITAGANISWVCNPPAGIAGAFLSGTTTIQPQTLVNTTNAAITVDYIATAATSGGTSCPGASSIHSVIVNPLPAIMATPTVQTICSNTITAIALSSPVTGATFSWTFTSSGSITGASNNTGNDIAQTLVNSSASIQTVTYTITPTYTNKGVTCTGNPISVVITVNPEPSVTNTPLTQSICSGATTQLVTLTSLVAGASFSWTATGTNGITGYSGIGTHTIPAEVLTNSTFSDGTVTYVIIPSANNCKGPSVKFITTVHPVATVNNPALSQTICSGDANISVTLTSNVPGANFTWTAAASTGISGFLPSGTNTIPAQTITNSTSLIGTVTYLITPAFSGCAGTQTSYKIDVNPSPQLQFSAPDQTICSNTLSAPITITSTTTGVNITWTCKPPVGISGAATSGTTTIPVQTLVNSTNAPITVSYIAVAATTGNATCLGAATTYNIIVNPSPQVLFSAPGQTICSGSSTAAITLSSLTTGAGITWSCIPPAGITGAVTSGTTTIPAQTLGNTTNAPVTVDYVATATTTGTASCPGTSSTYRITVNPLPDISATPNAQTICSGVTTNIFLSSLINGTAFSWTFSTSGNITGASAGSGDLIAQALVNNSTSPQTVTYTVTPAFTNNGILCNGSPIAIIVTVNPVASISNNPLTQTNCTGTFTTPVTWTSITSGASYTWTGSSSTGVTGFIASGSGNLPAMKLINGGVSQGSVIYSVSSAANACPGASNDYTIFVNPDAKASFTFDKDTSCWPFPLNIQNNSPSSANSIYNWYANNTIIGAAITFPGYSIPAPASSATIKLVAISKFGCKDDSLQHTFFTLPKPDAKFTLSPKYGCGPLVVTFNNTTPLRDTFAYFWNFGNGLTSTLAQPTPITFLQSPFYNDTTYQITLKAYNGCDTTFWRDSVKIRSNPKARFGVATTFGCSPFTVKINNNSLGTPNTYYWDFGNGHKDTTFVNGPLNYTFNIGNAVDTFPIRLIAVNECGSDTQFIKIRIAPNLIKPQVTINATDLFGCSPHIVAFNNATTGATSFIWNYGDGTVPDTTNTRQSTVLHTFTAPGTFNIIIQMTNGCSDTTVTRQVTVFAKPVAAFTTNASSYCLGDTIRVNNASLNASNYTWFWGDGKSNTGFNPVHVYTVAGNYTILLRAEKTNNNGIVCFDTLVRKITVLIKPDVTLQSNIANTNCAPFTLNATAPGIINETVTWYITDTTVTPSLIIQRGINANYTFKKPGTFSVKMIAVNAIGCADSTIKTFVVRGTPAASFTPNTIAVCKTDTTVSYLNTTTFNDFGPLTYRWLVDGVLKGTNGNFTYQYFTASNVLLPKIFTTQLIATNSVGCSDTAIGTLQMNPNAKALFSFGNTNQCVPFVLPVNNASLYATKYKWYLNGVLIDTASNPSISITKPLFAYTIRLIADNGFGCKPDTFQLAFTSRIKPAAAFTLSDTLGCTGFLNIATVNRSTNASSYVWDWGDATAQSSFTNPSHLYNTQGQYVISLVASDGVCKDTAYKNVVVSKKPVADFSVNDSVTCDTARIQFINLTTGADRYLWRFSDGNTSTQMNPLKNFAPNSAAYSVKLIAYNNAGCSDSVTKANIITAIPLPVADFFIAPSPLINIPDYTFSFNNLTLDNIKYTYQWNLGDGNFASTRNIVNHKYADTGQYTVRLIVLDNNTGCPDTVSKVATIAGKPGHLYVPNAFYPNSIQNQFKTFKPLGKGLATYRLQIFDGWGRLLFETKSLNPDGSPQEAWDGRYKGVLMQQDAYVWKIEATFRNGTSWNGMSYNNGRPQPFGSLTLFY